LPIDLENAWEMLFSEAGLRAWLGDLPRFHAVKVTDFADLSDRDIGQIMLRLNHYPHKCLGF
jgi:hypothetical protein